MGSLSKEQACSKIVKNIKTKVKSIKPYSNVFLIKLYFSPSISIIRWNEKTLHHKGPTLGAYNWTDIERYDTTDLQLLLRELEPYTKYEILLQAYNQFGRGPVAKIEAETGEKGEWLPSKDEVRLPNILTWNVLSLHNVKKKFSA